ncbi:MAG: dihydroorotate dehydrogenase-like protein [Anaerolineae bacterium]
MSDLSTTYMGLNLRNPIVPSASPLSRNLDGIKQMEDAGAGAVVLYSLFEEQIDQEAQFLDEMIESTKYRYAEMIDLFPPQDIYRRDEHAYLDLIRRAKESVDIPIIPSLNGYSLGGWLRYAALCEEAGADGLELNIYYLPTSHRLTGAQVEALYFELLRNVKQHVSIPIAVKMNPFFSSLPHIATLLDRAGAEALVFFNRFYQPDLDIEALQTVRKLHLSSSKEMLLPLRWIAILYGRLNASLALSTGVHTVEDVVKAIMAGADVANVCSVLLQEGIDALTELVTGLEAWMDAHEYENPEQMRGLLSHQKSPNPTAFERANYVHLIGQNNV